MKFEVTVREEAHANIFRNAEWWLENHSPTKAEQWLIEVYRQIGELTTMPERHGLAPESDKFAFDLRQKFVGLGSKPSYKALFRIDANRVEVLTFLASEQDAWNTDS